MAQTDIIAQVKTVLLTVSGIGLVSDRPGGSPPWVTNPRPRQAYWELDIGRIDESSGVRRGSAAIGQQVFEWHTVRLEGWMVHNYKEDSARKWRGLVDRVRAALRENRSLGLTVNRTELPRMAVNDMEASPVGADPDARQPSAVPLCHHCVIEMDVRVYTTYTAV